MPTPKEYFQLSDNAYSDPTQDLPSGWEVITEYDNPETGYQATAFINPSTNEIVIAHRGSQDAMDWEGNREMVRDVNMSRNEDVPESWGGGDAMDTTHNQTDEAIDFTKSIMEGYPSADISTTGHSLGGHLAEVTGAVTGVNAVSFDSPGSKDQIEQLTNTTEGHNITAYVSNDNMVNEGDRILGRVGDTIYLNGEQESGFQFNPDAHTREHFGKFFSDESGEPLPHCVDVDTSTKEFVKKIVVNKIDGNPLVVKSQKWMSFFDR